MSVVEKLNKLIFLSDVHFRSTKPVSRIEETYSLYIEEEFTRFEKVLNTKPDAVFIAGDFFHAPIVDLNVVFRLKKILDRHKIQVYTNVGNHDTYTYAYDQSDYTSLDVLELICEYFHVLKDKGREIINGASVSWYGWGHYEDYLENGNQEHSNITLVHAPVCDTKTFIKSLISVNKILGVDLNSDIVVFGDIHTYMDGYESLDGSKVVNPGPFTVSNSDELDKNIFYIEYDISRKIYRQVLMHDQNTQPLIRDKKAITVKDKQVLHEYDELIMNKNKNLLDFIKDCAKDRNIDEDLLQKVIGRIV